MYVFQFSFGKCKKENGRLEKRGRDFQGFKPRAQNTAFRLQGLDFGFRVWVSGRRSVFFILPIDLKFENLYKVKLLQPKIPGTSNSLELKVQQPQA